MTKNFKGGYKIVSLQNNDLASNFTLKGLHEALANSYEKPILVEDIVISTEKKNDAYAVVNKSGTSYVIEVYNKILTVTTADAVTVTTKSDGVTSIGGVSGEITLGTGLSITEEGELSASGGGGGSIYCHALRFYGGTGANAYNIYLTLFCSRSIPFTSISDFLDYMYTNRSGGAYSYLANVSGVKGSSDSYELINKLELKDVKPTTDLRFMGFSSSLGSHSIDITISTASFEDVVYEL